MSILMVSERELLDIIQYINLIKIRFGEDDVWAIAPVLYSSSEAIDVLVDIEKLGYAISCGEKVILRFQRFGFEYLLSGEVISISADSPAIMSIKVNLAQKYCNLRKYFRFDVNLKVMIEAQGHGSIDSSTRNISKGGTMIVTSEDFENNSSIEAHITFNSGNILNTRAKILRKVPLAGNLFSYGIQFTEMSEDNSKVLNIEISKYEREYLKSLDILREYKRKSEVYFDSRIAIISFDIDDSYGIRESLVKLGADNFEVFHDFKFFVDYLTEEKPKILIVDLEEFDKETEEKIINIKEEFNEIKIIVLIQLQKENQEIEREGFEDITILYKPLIFDEFENEIIKYL